MDTKNSRYYLFLSICQAVCVVAICAVILSHFVGQKPITRRGAYELGAYHCVQHQKYCDGELPSRGWRRIAVNHDDGNMDSLEVWAIRDSVMRRDAELWATAEVPDSCIYTVNGDTMDIDSFFQAHTYYDSARGERITPCVPGLAQEW